MNKLAMMFGSQQAKIPFSYSKPIPWRIVDEGLSLEGRCLSKNGYCQAYGQMVIGSLKMGQFTISRISTFACPMCGGSVRAKKFGINRCQWREKSANVWTTVGDVYHQYDLTQLPLEIEIRRLPTSTAENSSSKSDCTICLLAMNEKNKCSILPCQHIFHMDCIHQWIDADEEASLQCPLCRRPIFE